MLQQLNNLPPGTVVREGHFREQVLYYKEWLAKQARYDAQRDRQQEINAYVAEATRPVRFGKIDVATFAPFHPKLSALQTLTKWMQDFEVIVINDGSKDRTGEIVARLSTYDQRIRLIDHQGNRGYGAALVSGFEAVTKDLAFFMDSDGQFDIQDLARFFPLIEEYGAVLGYRIERQDTWMRKLNAWCWKRPVWFMFGIYVRDLDCAFKLFRTDFFRAHSLETRGAMINAEILYKLSRAGYTYTEMGVQHLPRRAGKATGAKPSVIFRALREMLVFSERWRQEEQKALSI